MPSFDLNGGLTMSASGLISAMEETFPPQTITPSKTMEQIQYEAGQAYVISWAKRFLDEYNNSE